MTDAPRADDGKSHDSEVDDGESHDSEVDDREVGDSKVGDSEGSDTEPVFEAAEYADGSVTYPPHPIGPNGDERVGTVDLREYTGRVVTWTTSTATPPGVRQPNTLAIVEFDLADYGGQTVRAIGQVVDGEEVAVGDEVEPVYAATLREPGAGIREPESQEWDGFRFRPIR
jgi:hypothetical protein